MRNGKLDGMEMNDRTCPRCNGRGTRARLDTLVVPIDALQPCEVCVGTGQVPEELDVALWEDEALTILAASLSRWRAYEPRVIRRYEPEEEDED